MDVGDAPAWLAVTLTMLDVDGLLTAGCDLRVRDGDPQRGEDARMIGRLKTVVLDAADMHAEAQFWAEVLGIAVVQQDDDWTTLEGPGVRLAVQLAPDHVPPQWPDPAHPQQLHLDVQVDDPDDAERQVLALGARRLPDPPDAEDFRVFADPAGHPFCLVFDV